MESRKNKILGGLLGAAVGDAMGAATEMRTTALIKQRFGGLVTDFVEHPDDNLSRGTPAGLVTDDFSIAYFTAEEMLERKSRITHEIAEAAMLRWSKHEIYRRFVGPTTNEYLAVLKGEEKPAPLLEMPVQVDRLLCNNTRATNGAGMKSGLMGLFNPCDMDRAIDEAIIQCSGTHNNVISLSAACAVAAATAAAFGENISYLEILEAGIYGAEEGYRRAEKTARPAAGGNIVKKIRLAVQIGMRHQGDFDKAMGEITDIIGGGIYAYEAIPAVFGHIAACKGRAMESIIMGVNAGDDTDTVACMTGYITGAMHGADVFPIKHLELIDRVNHFDLRQMADDIGSFLNAEKEGAA